MNAQRSIRSRIAVVAIPFVLVACASGGGAGGGGATTAGTPSDVRIVKSFDGRYDGEVSGTMKPGSKFAGIQIGMTMAQVQEKIGTPERFHSYESGKRWIPFYYGNDARRMQALYRGAGCLIFTDGNIFGGGGNELLRIDHDDTDACYQP